MVFVYSHKVRNFLGIISISLISSYFAMFYLNLSNPYVYIFLKIISFLLIPTIVSFSWLYFWTDSEDPFRYLALWNTVTQALFLLLNLFRINDFSWGFFGWSYLLVSVVIIFLYLTEYHMSLWGFWVTGILILLNVVLAFSVVMTTFNLVHPFFSVSPSLRALGDFITGMSVMGALFTSSSQLYWHEILKKRRDEMIMHQVWASIDEEMGEKDSDV